MPRVTPGKVTHGPEKAGEHHVNACGVMQPQVSHRFPLSGPCVTQEKAHIGQKKRDILADVRVGIPVEGLGLRVWGLGFRV